MAKRQNPLSFFVDKVFSFLGMRKDPDFSVIKPGSYLEGYGVDFITQIGSSEGVIQTILGNQLAYTLPVVAAQNKTFRIYLDATAGSLGILRTISFFNGNGLLITTAGYTPSVNLATTYAAANAAISAAIPTTTVGALVTTGTNLGYFDFSIDTVAGWDYTISLATTYATEILPIITKEAIDTSMAGQLLHNSKGVDLDGDLFVWSCTKVELSVEAGVFSFTNNGAGLYRVVTNIPLGGVTGGNVIIKKAPAIGVNGTWIITVINATTFDLQGSVFSSNGSGGTAVINSRSVGEIGVAVKDDNSDTWSYKTLLRSWEFNFRVVNQVKVVAERNDLLASFYYIDGKNGNVPRVTYYRGDYITNGAIQYVNPAGEYVYGGIADAISLLINVSNFGIGWTSQLQSGGGTTSGNKRYAARLLTDNFSATLPTDLTNPINTCVENALVLNSSGGVYPIGGNSPGQPTGKINNLLLTLDPGLIGLFKYVELIVVEYVGGVPVATIVKRDVLNQTLTQIIQHTGLEQDTQTFDIAEFSRVFSDIQTAEGIALVDKRLVLANTTSSDSLDFSDFAATFQHTIDRRLLSGVLMPQTGTYQSGEYIDPNNVYNSVGYMANEIYALFAKFKLKSGQITQAFWIDWIRIDTLVNNNIANPTDNRRTGAGSFTTYDLTDAAAGFVYVPHITWTIPNLDFIINGVPARSLIQEIIFERVDMIPDYQEVMACGAAVLGVDMNVAVDTTNPPYEDNIITHLNYLNTGALGFIDYPFAAGEYFYDGTPQALPNNVNYNFTAYTYDILGLFTPFYTRQRQFFSFYSPEFMYNNSKYGFQAGDQLLNFGTPQNLLDLRVGAQGSPGGCAFFSMFREFAGYFNKSTYQAGGLTVSGGAVIAQGSNALISGQKYNKTLGIRASVAPNPGSQFEYQQPSSPVIKTAVGLTDNGTGFTEYGVNSVQYYRFKSVNGGISKFGSKTGLKSIPTGCSLKIDQGTPTSVSGIRMFGGDVFTQKTYIKHMMPQTASAFVDPHNYNVTGFGGGFSFYSQNRVNTQMRNVENTPTSLYRYPAITVTNWLEDLNLAAAPTYNVGYNIINGVQADAAFDVNAPRSNSQPAHIPYSDEKPENSVLDNYRIFAPFNFSDLLLGNGAISDIKNINGELMAFQSRAFQLLNFNMTGLLVTSSTDVVFGNAGIMTTKPKTLSTYGTNHGFSVIVGKTASGKDSVAWICAEFGKVMRYEPSDGTICLSDEFDMDSFFTNNLRFAQLYFSPAAGRGIHGTWDDQRKQYLWTVMGHKNVNLWVVGHPYIVGSEVYLVPSIPVWGQQVDIFVCLVFNTSDPTNKPDSGVNWQTYWMKVPHNSFSILTPGVTGANLPVITPGVQGISNQYFNEYTVAFSEKMHAFTTFWPFTPKVYLSRNNLMLSPRPIANEGRCYEHGALGSEYNTWYNQDGANPEEQSEDAYIVLVYGKNPDQPKTWMALGTNSEIIPFRFDVYTKTNYTYMNDIDTEGMNGEWLTAIKNDVLQSLINFNDDNTDQPNGAYVLIKVTLEKKKFQKISSMVIKFSSLPRSMNM